MLLLTGLEELNVTRKYIFVCVSTDCNYSPSGI